MENLDFSVVDEGGIKTIVDLESDVLELIFSNPKLQCPQCGDVVTLNGRCKTCPSCGWSSCDL